MLEGQFRDTADRQYEVPGQSEASSSAFVLPSCHVQKEDPLILVSAVLNPYTHQHKDTDRDR